MKKIIKIHWLLIIIFWLLVSCRSSDETQKLNPPTWIHGKWYSDGNLKYIFTQDDFVIVNQASQFSYKAYLKHRGRMNIVIQSDSEYSFDISSNISIGVNEALEEGNSHFEFKKNMNNSITDRDNIILIRN
ncbi:hypothetical protein CMT84_18045 [Elizabethkingia anophelis]|nr:hypothetical protein [Elizabethkingia anophelis]